MERLTEEKLKVKEKEDNKNLAEARRGRLRETDEQNDS